MFALSSASPGRVAQPRRLGSALVASGIIPLSLAAPLPAHAAPAAPAAPASALNSAAALPAAGPGMPGAVAALPRLAASTTVTHTVQSGDTLTRIASRHGIGVQALASHNGLSLSSLIFPGQRLTIPGSTADSGSGSEARSTSSSTSASARTYTVKVGDSLYGISSRTGVSVATLQQLNGLKGSSLIHPGQVLKLSAGSTASTAPSASGSTASSSATRTASTQTYTVQRGDSLSAIARKHGVSLSSLLQLNGLRMTSVIHPGQRLVLAGGSATSSSTSSRSADAPSTAVSSGTYTVVRGDSLYKIANRHGMSLQRLLDLNGLQSTSVIYPGQTLKVSGTASTSTQRSATTSSSSSSSAVSSYTVVRGDTLSGIASRHGISLSTLLRLNGLQVSSIIYPGQSLKVSGSVERTSASTTPTPVTGGAAPDVAPQDQLVPSTFLGRTYPDHVVNDANANKRLLLSMDVPSRAEMQRIVRDTAVRMGVDPRLALAHASVESAFDQRAVSPANAIGTMQVIPSSGEWASRMVGRDLNLLDPHDNVVAGVAIIRWLHRNAPSYDYAIAGYYQGLGGVTRNGMRWDTVMYVDRIKAAYARF